MTPDEYLKEVCTKYRMIRSESQRILESYSARSERDNMNFKEVHKVKKQSNYINYKK